MSTIALSLPFEFDQPVWLWLIALVPVLVLASQRSLAGLDPVRRVSALVVRSVLVVLIACCLARIQHVRRNTDATTIFLMDRSHSVEQLQQFQDDFIRTAAEQLPQRAPQDRIGVIDFAKNAYLEQMPMVGGYHIPPGRLPSIPGVDRTNIAAALRLAMAMFPHDTAKRIVLMSDGNDNMGDVLAEARRAKADQIPIDVVPLWYKRTNEVYFDRMIAPTYVEPGELIPIRMRIHTDKRVTGKLLLYQDGQPIPLPPQSAHVELAPGNNTFIIKPRVEKAGAHTFEAVFEPDEPWMDASPLNNNASTFSFVSGKRTALLITNNIAFDTPLIEALRSENVRVDVKSTSDLGTFSLLDMMSYATIILSNVPAATFTDKQQESLATYVRDMGSGLIMIGGDEGFGAGGWIGSPVEEVMPITFEIKHKRVIPQGALVLILHSCEIPRGNYWGKEMAKKSVDTISSQDMIGILAYTYSPGGANWEVPLDKAGNKAAVKSKIDKMQIGDMPDFGRTMQMALDELTVGRGRTAAQKHVIILSDGDAQPPSASLIRKYQQARITVSTIGIGWGAHVMANSMQFIAKQTGGKFYTARNPRQLPQIFVKESKVVRRTLIVEETFRPQVLHSQSELLAGIRMRETLPDLGGLVLTSPKQSPHVIIPLIRATDDGEDPVLVHWQYELGKAVAFTSGYWPVWGQRWTNWPKFARFWAQIVRWSMRQDTPANFDTYTRIEGNRGRIVIDALDKDATYLNMLQLQSVVVGPNQERIPLRFTQTGPGHYEAEIEIETAGQFLANIQINTADGQNLGTIRTGFSLPYSPEYRDREPNEALLRQVAEITGGRWLDLPAEQADVFAKNLPPTKSKRPAWPWVLSWLLLPAFLLDVSVRRLASWLAMSIVIEILILVVLLFGVGLWIGPWWSVLGVFLLADLVGWLIRFRYIVPLFDWMTHTVTVLGQTGDRSALALEKLKRSQKRVRDGLSPIEDDPAGGEPPSPLPRAVARRRYDSGDDQTPTQPGDLQEALGGAKAESKPSQTSGRGSGRDSQDAEDKSTTSRLLQRKRKREDEG